MARRNRRDTINPLAPGLYHITVKTVRGLHLLGDDRTSGNDYNYRRALVKERIRKMAANFGIVVVFAAIMGNHLHLVLGNLPFTVKEWSDSEVMRRACRIFSHKFKRMGIKNETPTEEQLRRLVEDRNLVSTMRERLSDPSWFMKQLLQKLATDFNKADDKRGHWVAGRFHHRVITDEKALLICGIYIDLNQIAAMEADRPEFSLHTSAGMRIAGALLRSEGQLTEALEMDGFLLPINVDGDGQGYPAAGTAQAARASDAGMFEFSEQAYLKLLDELGRKDREGKRGKIPGELAPILERLEMDREMLEQVVNDYTTLFRAAVGSSESLEEFSNAHDGIGSRDAEAMRELESRYAARRKKKKNET